MLALAEVKETWHAWPSDSDPWDDYDYYDDEEEDDKDADDDDDEEEDYGHDGVSRGRGSDDDDYQLNELIDDEITLGWWTSPDGTGGEPISLHVPGSEVGATTPSAELIPYQSEYEGYMGNYGNTLDRWYRRAAVVVWARDRAFAAPAEALPQWALSELRTRPEAGDLEGARAGAESLAPFWKRSDRRPDCWARRCMWRRAWRGRDGGDAAGAVPGGDGRAGARGRGWRRPAVRRGMDARGHRRVVRAEVLPRGGPARVGGEAAGAVRSAACRRGPELGRLLAADAWGWMGAQLRLWTTTARTEIREPRLEMLGSPLVRLLEAADDAGRDRAGAGRCWGA